jgi:hypothetical protein
MAGKMKERTFYSVCGLALLIFGCPKRQTTPRIVYVPAPPAPAAAGAAPSSGTLVIQEPPPPEPQPVVIIEEPPPEEKPAPRRRRPAAPEQRADEPAEAETPAAEVPALEPRESPAQQTAQRQEIIQMLGRIRGKIAQLKEAKLGEAERRSVDDAQMFLEQSQHALEANDLTRALNLARKASLLVNSTTP